MKKRLAAILGIGIVVAGLFGAAPATAAGGSWQPYGTSFTTPSNWYCSATGNNTLISSQSCVVRSGNYVQAATIVRNLSSSQVSVRVDDQALTTESGAKIGKGDCVSSGVAANSFSVCFSPTVAWAGPVKAAGLVWQAGGNGWMNVSPWA